MLRTWVHARERPVIKVQLRAAALALVEGIKMEQGGRQFPPGYYS